MGILVANARHACAQLFQCVYHVVPVVCPGLTIAGLWPDVAGSVDSVEPRRDRSLPASENRFKKVRYRYCIYNCS